MEWDFLFQLQQIPCLKHKFPWTITEKNIYILLLDKRLTDQPENKTPIILKQWP